MNERPEPDRRPRVGRRTALQSLGAGVVALGLGVAGTASAQERFPPSDRTHWGRPKRLGDGTMATFFAEGRSGAPRYLGVWFTADALDGLPQGGESPSRITELPLPAAAEDASNFEWASVDWNPSGHLPREVYDVPHFDFHFYTMERAAVHREIPPGECDADGDGAPEAAVPCEVQARGTEPLPDAQLPEGYVSTDDTVPLMGNHWVDSEAPELSGEPFTHTWIYGSFDGEITFLEPMITTEFLRGLRGRVVADVKTPERFPQRGFYPTQYVIRHLRRQDAYAVFLRRFKQFEGS
ncbi:DUF5602 domain-containing protein (plasmid) [Halorussus limi]|uniref:DUF5602 domain-containing protein n=1 Tax=Halorussus limi TaxID=2938695 RepID=A0A8U0HZ93_9EURY|nr:DUF5602 domain-containing protein [Halorussus limi]UPV76350.1 DUF5602 domain-containing protein [Halorussus limi]